MAGTKTQARLVIHQDRHQGPHSALADSAPGFPLMINGLEFATASALKEALNHPEDATAQHLIAALRHRNKAHLKMPTPQQRDARHTGAAAAFAIGMKLLQHPKRFGKALTDTNGLMILPEPGHRHRSDDPRNQAAGMLSTLRAILNETGDPESAVRQFLVHKDLAALKVNGRSVEHYRPSPEETPETKDTGTLHGPPHFVCTMPDETNGGTYFLTHDDLDWLWTTTAELSRRHGLSDILLSLTKLPYAELAAETDAVRAFIIEANEQRLQTGADPNAHIDLETQYLESHVLPEPAARELEKLRASYRR